MFNLDKYSYMMNNVDNPFLHSVNNPFIKETL